MIYWVLYHRRWRKYIADVSDGIPSLTDHSGEAMRLFSESHAEAVAKDVYGARWIQMIDTFPVRSGDPS